MYNTTVRTITWNKDVHYGSTINYFVLKSSRQDKMLFNVLIDEDAGYLAGTGYNEPLLVRLTFRTAVMYYCMYLKYANSCIQQSSY